MRKVKNVRAVARGAMVHMLMAVAITAGVGMGAVLPAAPAMADDAKAMKNSPEFAKAAAPMQKTMHDIDPLVMQFANAAPDARGAVVVQLKAALAAANATAEMQAAEAAISLPLDRYLAGRWAMKLGLVTDDMILYQHGLQNVVDSGAAPAEDRDNNLVKLGKVSYQNKDYATSIKALQPLVSANTANDAAAEVLALDYQNLGQPAQALATLKAAVDGRKAAGGVVSPEWLIRANYIASHANMNAEGTEWALRTVALYPTPANFLKMGQLVRIYSDYDSPESLDISRLAFRAGALTVNNAVTQEEYREYLAAADARRYPGEVLSVIKAGVAAGAVDGSSQGIVEKKSIASKGEAGDRASLAGFVRDAHAPNAAKATVTAAADTLLSYGQAAQAIELYQIALGKPGVDVAVVLTRLGIAQMDTGDYAGAQATFAKVEGKRKPLAALWAIYAQSKAGAK